MRVKYIFKNIPYRNDKTKLISLLIKYKIAFVGQKYYPSLIIHVIVSKLFEMYQRVCDFKLKYKNDINS